MKKLKIYIAFFVNMSYNKRRTNLYVFYREYKDAFQKEFCIMKRENFGSRLGFLLVSAGCAIGIGNVWRFPFITGEYGGAVFVLIYLLFLAILGIPVLTMEFSVGRAGRGGAVQAYKNLEPKGTFWHNHGWLCLLGLITLMSYYTTVSGWMTAYFYKFAVGEFTSGMTADEVGSVFGALLASPSELIFWMGITIALGFAVVSCGIKSGVERITKGMMLSLLVLIVILAINSATLDGAAEGLSFYLVPDFERAFANGVAPVVTAAMAQAFFTLSIGIGSMEIFGSYIARDRSLVGESFTVCGLDTFVAIMAGLIIFPACSAFGVSPDAGPALIFVTLPNVFVNMDGGRIWGTLFFLFMTFASFSTVIAVFEGIMASLLENLPMQVNRRVMSMVATVVLFCLSVPCALSFNVWSDVTIFGKGILDAEDFLVSNILLPSGGMIFLLFCCLKSGWGYENYLKEVNAGVGMKMSTSPILRYYLTFCVPLMIMFILLQGLGIL